MTLLYPLFFLGLTALALPWLLHRFNRETPPVTLFPSTQFLEATRVPVSRRKRLRHWALLALRALLLAVLCLLFTQPQCSLNSSEDDTGNITFVVIDRSASMQAGDRWSQAIAAAAEAISAAQQSSSAVQFFDFASNLTPHGELSNNVTQANAALRNLSVSNEKAEYGVVMQQLDAVAARQETAVNVVLITDAQASNLPLQRRLLRTRNIHQLTLLPVTDDVRNVAVRATAVTQNGVNLVVTAQVQLSESKPSTKSTDTVELSVQVANEMLRTVQVPVSAEEATSITLDDLILPSSVADTLRVTVTSNNDDALAIDNSVQVPIERVQPIPVALIALSGRPPEASALFLRTALSTDNLARVIATTGAGSSLSDQAKHWVVFASVGADANYQLPNEVSEFVETGGNVLVVLQTDKNSQSRTDLNIDEGAQAGLQLAAGDYIGSVDIAHPLALGELDWQAASVYAPIAITPSPADRVLMRTGAGSPLLLERTMTPNVATSDTSLVGRVLIVADPLDGIASDIPLQSSFVDWIAQTVRWFDASAAFPKEINAGEILRLPARSQVLSPSGRALQTLADTANASQLQLNELGVHTVVTPVAEHQVVVVLPWLESKLDVISEELQTNWAEGVTPNAENMPESDSAAISQVVASGMQAQSSAWWPWLLPLLALALCAESLMANRKLAVRRDGL